MQRRRGLELFKKELDQEEEDVDLLKAAVFIAQHRTPELDADAVIRKIDAMVEELQEYLPPPDERYPLRMIGAISKFLYEVKGVKGNSEDYYNPDNSCIDKVIENSTGIPISISLLYMELARRVDFPMIGVNLPTHFMIRPLLGEVEILVDAFNQGKVMFVEDAEELLQKHYGPGTSVTIDRTFFQDNAVRNRNFLTRMLTNLKQIYFDKKEYELALMITEYQQECSPTEEVLKYNSRDRGILLYLLQRYPEARLELSEYLAASPNASDFERVSGIIESMRMPTDFGGMRFSSSDEDGEKNEDDQTK